MLRVPPAPVPMRVAVSTIALITVGCWAIPRSSLVAHAEIVIGEPHDHVARPLRGMPDRVREAAGEPFEIGKNPVAALVPEPGKGICEIRVVIHGLRFSGKESPLWNAPKLFLEAFQGSCRGGNEVAQRRGA